MTSPHDTPETELAIDYLGWNHGEWVGVEKHLRARLEGFFEKTRQFERDRNRLRAQLADVVERCAERHNDWSTMTAANLRAKYPECADLFDGSHCGDEFIRSLLPAEPAKGEAVAWLIKGPGKTVVQLTNKCWKDEIAIPLYASPQAAEGKDREDAERYRAGLQWYADGNHYTLPEWDTEEGWLCPPNSESWMVEPGYVARSILAGQQMNPDKDADEITIDARADKGGSGG